MPCLSVCLSVKSHFTSGAYVHRENAATYSVGNDLIVALLLQEIGLRAVPLISKASVVQSGLNEGIN